METQKKHIKNGLLDLGPLLKPYENKWVALSKNKTEIVASGDSLLEVVNNLPSGSTKDAVSFMHVIPLDQSFASFLRQ